MSARKTVILPATDPLDTTYGVVPSVLAEQTNVLCVSYARQVWYNAEIRAQAIEQIDPFLAGEPGVLVGFSKSGLGVLNLIREYPHTFSTGIVFDSPVCRRECPPWGTAEFYDQAGWESDQPGLQARRYAECSRQTALIVITGTSFRDEMLEFHRLLLANGGESCLLDLKLSHHWESGWIEQGLAACTAP